MLVFLALSVCSYSIADKDNGIEKNRNASIETIKKIFFIITTPSCFIFSLMLEL